MERLSRPVLLLWDTHLLVSFKKWIPELVYLNTLSFINIGGTTDGPGAFDFVQGDNSSQSQNPFWQIVKGEDIWLQALAQMVDCLHVQGAVTPYPSAAQIACQYPKPILLNTVSAIHKFRSCLSHPRHTQGYAHTPYEWLVAVTIWPTKIYAELVLAQDSCRRRHSDSPSWSIGHADHTRRTHHYGRKTTEVCSSRLARYHSFPMTSI